MAYVGVIGIGNKHLPKVGAGNHFNQLLAAVVIQFIEYIVNKQQRVKAFGGFYKSKLRQLYRNNKTLLLPL